MEPLALSYRPRTFDDLVGQPAVQVILRQMVKTRRIPHALLFAGCRGTGKTTTARILAAALNCDGPDAPCGRCVPCKETFDGSSMDVLEIDAASNGLVDDIRQLRQTVLYRTNGRYRVVILDEAQSISQAGFNALLKTLEEPPLQTVFILLTTEPNKILATVASRCMPFQFKRLSINDIATRLAHIASAEGKLIEPDLVRLLADRADGAMRDAVMLLDQVTRIGMTTGEQYLRLIGHADHAPAIFDRLLHGDIPGALARLEEAFTRVAEAASVTAEMINVLRDVLVLRCGGDLAASGAPLAARQNLALSMETPVVMACLKVLWQLKTQLRNDDPRSSLELAVIMLSEVIHTLSPPPKTRMNLDDMGKQS
jgi:DNA polymerase III subunit gamma/tau